MTKSILLSLLGAAVLGSTLLAGCGDSDKKPETAAVGTSGDGQSCVRTADCAPGFVCFSNVCATSPTTEDGGVPTTPLGGVGESCQAHSDCGTGLGCYNGRCASAPTGDAGITVQLGQRGEACQAAADCASGLTCIVISTATAVCDIAKFPTPPTGQVCGECKTADDCCELPASLEGITVYSNGANIASCADVADALMGVTCSTATGVLAQLCFIQATYCTCAPNPWACTANRCEYTASCKGAGGIAKNGCPLETRTGSGLVSTCDSAAGGSMKCAPAATVVTGCKSDDECATNSQIVQDDQADTCTAGECACVLATGFCYRKCARNIDCAAGFVCDAMTSLCVVQSGCTVDADCILPVGDVTAKCSSGLCTLPCVTDHDCSNSGVLGINSANGSVCSAGACTVPSQCTSDDSCQAVGNRRQFCVGAATGTTLTTVHSAITGGNGK